MTAAVEQPQLFCGAAKRRPDALAYQNKIFFLDNALEAL